MEEFSGIYFVHIVVILGLIFIPKTTKVSGRVLVAKLTWRLTHAHGDLQITQYQPISLFSKCVAAYIATSSKRRHRLNTPALEVLFAVKLLRTDVERVQTS